MDKNEASNSCDFLEWLELRQPDSPEDKKFLISALKSPGHYGRYSSSASDHTMEITSRGLRTYVDSEDIEHAVAQVQDLDINDLDDLDQQYRSIMREPTKAKGD